MELYSPTGGASLASDPNSTISYITIAASDNPYGVFKIAASQQQYTVNEGDTVSVVVERTGGTFGIVEIRYRVVGQNDGDIVTSPSRGTVGSFRNFVFLVKLPYLGKKSEFSLRVGAKP